MTGAGKSAGSTDDGRRLGEAPATRRCTAATVLFWAALATTAGQASGAADRALENMLDHVVRIEATDPRQGGAVVGFGAGFLVGQTTTRVYIATANHVVRGADGLPRSAKVTLRAFGLGTVDAQLLAPFDAALDLAVLSIPAPPLERLNLCGPEGQLLEDMYPQFANRARGLAPGASVFPLGHPNGRPWLVLPSSGQVVTLNSDRIEFYSAWLSPGHSGGALVDGHSALIGMVLRDSAPLGEALPVERVLNLLRDWGVPVTLATQKLSEWGSPWTFAQAEKLDHLLKARDTEGLAKALRDCRLGHILEVRRRTLNARQYWGLGRDHIFTPSLVWLAARENDVAALRLFLAAQMSANDRAGPAGQRPLELAAVLGHTEVTELLLQAGARIDDADGEGNTALHQAARARQWATAQLLVARGANATLRNRQDQTAADLAGGDADRLQPEDRTIQRPPSAP